MPPITLEDLKGQLDDLKDLVAKPRQALDALPKHERDAGREAQQSVVDARRRAETHEGLLQVN
jgi:hypothetical protein